MTVSSTARWGGGRAPGGGGDAVRSGLRQSGDVVGCILVLFCFPGAAIGRCCGMGGYGKTVPLCSRAGGAAARPALPPAGGLYSLPGALSPAPKSRNLCLF